MAEKRIETVEMRAGDVKTGFGNPRKITKKKKDELRNSIETFGDFGSFIIDENDNIIGGNMRLSVIKEMDPDTIILCKRLIGYSETELRAINIKDNTHSGDWDMDLLADWTADLTVDLGLEKATKKEMEERSIRLYEGNGLFTKIIDRPSEEAVKHGFDIDYGDEDITEYVDKRLDDLDFEDKFATAEKWARLYGGSLIVMLCDDGGGLEEPLNWDKVTTIEELRVFERAVIQEDYTTMYNFHFFDTMHSDKPFGQPEYYHIYSMYGYFTVHYSRCLVFRNGRLPEQTTNSIYRYWGMPEYVKINITPLL